MAGALAQAPLRQSSTVMRAVAKVVAVFAAAMAVADGFRWGNRWYVATQIGDGAMASDLLISAHEALVSGLVALLVALVAAVIGWRLRVTRIP